MVLCNAQSVKENEEREEYTNTNEQDKTPETEFNETEISDLYLTKSSKY